MKGLFSAYIRKRLHPNKVDSFFRDTLTAGVTFEREENQVAVIQKTISPVKRLEPFLKSIYETVNEAVNNKAKYVIFPEYIFFDLFGIIPFYGVFSNFLPKNVNEEQQMNIEASILSENRLLKYIFNLFAWPTEKVIIRTMQILAKHFSIYIFTGSYLHKENERLYNVGSFINPDGEVIHTQRKVHLTNFENMIGLSRGDGFSSLDLPIGKTATPICMDASYFETFQIVRQQGANIVIIPIANNEEYSEWKALRGIWPRVQESYVYGLKPALTGTIAGLTFTGKAGIFAPIDMTENSDGVIAITENSVGDEIIYGHLHIDKLINSRKNAQYQNDVNEEFERNFVNKTY